MLLAGGLDLEGAVTTEARRAGFEQRLAQSEARAARDPADVVATSANKLKLPIAELEKNYLRKYHHVTNELAQV